MKTKGMIQLKKVVSKKTTTTIGIYMNDFNCEHTWWSNKPVKAEFPIPLDTTCLFLRVGGFWPVFRHSKNPTSAKIYTTQFVLQNKIPSNIHPISSLCKPSTHLPHGLNFRSKTGFLKLQRWRTVFDFKFARRHRPSVIKYRNPHCHCCRCHVSNGL